MSDPNSQTWSEAPADSKDPSRDQRHRQFCRSAGSTPVMQYILSIMIYIHILYNIHVLYMWCILLYTRYVYVKYSAYFNFNP